MKTKPMYIDTMGEMIAQIRHEERIGASGIQMN